MKESAPLLTFGDVGLVRIGSSRVAVFAGISALHGTVIAWEDPLFTVRFDDGTSILLNAKVIVESLVFDPAEVCDPTRFYYGFERFHPAAVGGWRQGMLLVLRAEGLELPPDWLGDAAADAAANEHAAGGGSVPAITIFREHEARRLEELARVLGGEARAARTMRGLRNPALKALWWLASRGHGINPPPPAAIRLYLTFLVDLRACKGAVDTASQALSFLARSNSWPTGLMDGAARIPIDAARRMFRAQTKKTHGLRREDVARILKSFAVYLPGVPDRRQWAHAVGVAIGTGYMVFARFDDLRQMCFDDGHCVLEADHISFYVETRKNAQFQGSWVTIARPAGGAGPGVFGLLRELKMRLGSGFVLPSISADGVVDRSRQMPYDAFVLHLRNALIHIGFDAADAEHFAGHSMRSGAATATANELPPHLISLAAGVKDINWILTYHRASIGDRMRVSWALGL